MYYHTVRMGKFRKCDNIKKNIKYKTEANKPFKNIHEDLVLVKYSK